MPYPVNAAELLARQMGGLRVKKTSAPAPKAAAPAAAPAKAPKPAAAPKAVDIKAVAQGVAGVSVVEHSSNKELVFTFTDGTKQSVVVESTADLETKVAGLITAIKDLQAQAVQVASRLEAIEKVI